MNLNFILFPAPKKKYTHQQHQGELIWIPKLIYENLDSCKVNPKNVNIIENKKASTNEQIKHKRCQSSNSLSLQNSIGYPRKSNRITANQTGFNKTLNTRIDFFRNPIKQNDIMDKSYIEAETFIIHNEGNDEYNLDISQEEKILSQIQKTSSIKFHSKPQIRQQQQICDIKQICNKKTFNLQNTHEQQNEQTQNKIYLPFQMNEQTNQSFQSCSLLNECIDEVNQEEFNLQSPKNVQNYVSKIFLNSEIFSNKSKGSCFTSHTTSISGQTNDQISIDNQLNQKSQWMNDSNKSTFSQVKAVGAPSVQQRQPFYEIQENGKLINHSQSSRQLTSTKSNQVFSVQQIALQQQQIKEQKLNTKQVFGDCNKNSKTQHIFNKTQQLRNDSGSLNNIYASKNIQNKNQNYLPKDQKENQYMFSQIIKQRLNSELDYQYNINHSEQQKYIPCLFLKSYSPSNYVLIYFHGNGEDISLSYELTDHLRNTLKLNVLAVEYQGYGIYEGEPDENQILNDTQYVYNFLTEKLNYSYKNIIILGRSIGTGPATWLAANKKVGGLILISPFTSIRGVAKHVAGSFAQHLIKERFVNIENIQKVVCPTFIVHGQQDRLIPYQQSQQLLDYCKGPCQLILPKRMTHIELDYNQDLTNPLHSFLIKNGINIKLDNSMLTYQKYIQIPSQLYKEPVIQKQSFRCY
ncbi:alpha/beta superfamily hydrolase (macronuclear) [Tetrahymena thermophila SB210]|uniref:Alpha/beta superfamily hydrolase n=1 Tax=Tetrahymena thermophila (strain SB210) TaxID=312017 RepID=Q23RL8_TETTS|nr:alpha/beta superfamily hydrolase [Tetrahymena thermophila SB210]EAR99030.2 alpha/beta superfamily hydrolase [Tetrahymena thermophila SB210]|eukprot:XP_001019275.2 alpha/beta superfamily hydrolase [Tetrahymena thermophila SB210]